MKFQNKGAVLVHTLLPYLFNLLPYLLVNPIIKISLIETANWFRISRPNNILKNSRFEAFRSLKIVEKCAELLGL